MRITDHQFTSPAPTFGFDEDSIDPFYQADRAATSSTQSAAAKALSSAPLRDRAPVETEQ